MNNETKVVHLRIPTQLMKQISYKAVDRDMRSGAFIVQILTEWAYAENANQETNELEDDMWKLVISLITNPVRTATASHWYRDRGICFLFAW